MSILIPSGKGKHPLMMYRNHTFTFKVLSASGVLWHCSRRTRTGCKAFIKSLPDKMDVIIAAFDEHCHDARHANPKVELKPKFQKIIL
ncbi:FLYWCH zinc finger domain-containing protein [Phthorimaea operculella]|nr:FLYWCH zinc finger domain-containing protein [Phthorimaea operculella]